MHEVLLVFYVNQAGKLTKYEAEVGAGDLKKIISMDLKIKEEDFAFKPARLNGKSVPSKLIYKSTLTVN
ncbi:hypothetical protein [Pedobacter sandarakinus]|uniref:hypothetical protein n=1 Tax=Pedobacter sandarakinus TaxID=353156 RepID=UPI00224818DC|nr:hypothetical protein [Pedobacter sandarakinus]MCX2575020.1 hypothetical protein [Pedobacter sandarakinus]